MTLQNNLLKNLAPYSYQTYLDECYLFGALSIDLSNHETFY